MDEEAETQYHKRVKNERDNMCSGWAWLKDLVFVLGSWMVNLESLEWYWLRKDTFVYLGVLDYAKPMNFLFRV